MSGHITLWKERIISISSDLKNREILKLYKLQDQPLVNFLWKVNNEYAKTKFLSLRIVMKERWLWIWEDEIDKVMYPPFE